jgi:hypothetical protein
MARAAMASQHGFNPKRRFETARYLAVNITARWPATLQNGANVHPLNQGAQHGVRANFHEGQEWGTNSTT